MLRSYHVLFVLAGVLFFGGFALLDGGLDLRTSFQGEETFGIPAGAQWYYAVELPMQAGGRIYIEFQETAQRAIGVLVLEEPDYQAFLNARGVVAVLEGATGPSGVLALDLPDAGTYYLVFTHAGGTQAVLKEVELRYSFMGIQPPEPDWFLVGSGAVVTALGAVIVAMAARRRLRTSRGDEAEATA